MNDIRQHLDLISEYSSERHAAEVPYTTPRTSLPISYYMAAAAHLWVAVRFGLGNRLSRGGGDSSPVFDWFMTETKKTPGIVIGKSLDVINGEKEYKEHIVPCKLIVDRAIDIFQDGATPGELQDDKIELRKIKEVARLIRDNLFVVYISKGEASLIDNDLGLQTKMPSGWTWGDDVYARLKEVYRSGKFKGENGVRIGIPVYDINDSSKRIA